MKSKHYYTVVLTLLVLGVYSFTLLRGVGYSGDTAKFQFLGKVLGTGHEPGQPGYTMLNYLFVSIIPFGTPAVKANFLSAIFSMLTIITLFFLLQRLSVRRSISFITSLTFAFTYTLWSQSVIAEVYTLNILFVALTLFFFIRWRQIKRERDFIIGCIIYAVSFGNHLTIITFLPALIFFVWRTQKQYFWNPRIVFCVFGIILLGMSQYVYLFWRYYAPETSYLEIAIPDIKTFWYYISGGQFQDRIFQEKWNWMVFLQIPVVVRFILQEYLVLIVIAAVGFLRFGSLDINFTLLIGLLCSTGFVLGYHIPDIFVYLMPTYFILALYIGVGFERIFLKIAVEEKSWQPIFLMIIPLFFLVWNYNKADKSSEHEAATKTAHMLDIIGSHAIIVCPDYNYAEYFWYYQFSGERTSDNIYTYFTHGKDIPFHLVSAYIKSEKPLYLPVQRKFAPPHLDVYFCDAYQPWSWNMQYIRQPKHIHEYFAYVRSWFQLQKAKLLQSGFVLNKVAENLYRVELMQTIQNSQQ